MRRSPLTGPSRRRRTLLLAGALALLLALLLAPDALAGQNGLLTPASGGSPNANRISSLYRITLYIAIVIFVGVEATLGYALFRFRARRGRTASQFHGNTRLEIGWTIGAAVVLVGLAAVTFLELGSIRTPDNSSPGGLNVNDGLQYQTTGAINPPNGRALRIQVNGQQFVWRYTYTGFGKKADGLDDPYAYYEMVVPTDTTVVLKLVSQDVVHSWWIPQLGGKVQAVPGYTNYTWFKISKPGRYRGQCAFICGRGHARMLAVVDAVSPAQFTAWIARQKAAIASANAAASVARTKLAAGNGAGAVENP